MQYEGESLNILLRTVQNVGLGDFGFETWKANLLHNQKIKGAYLQRGTIAQDSVTAARLRTHLHYQLRLRSSLMTLREVLQYQLRLVLSRGNQQTVLRPGPQTGEPAKMQLSRTESIISIIA